MAITGIANALGQFGGDLGKASFTYDDWKRQKELDRLKMMEMTARLGQLRRSAEMETQPQLVKTIETGDGKTRGLYKDFNGMLFSREVPGLPAEMSPEERQKAGLMRAGLSEPQALRQVAPKAFDTPLKTIQAALVEASKAALARGVNPETDPTVQLYKGMLPKPRTPIEQQFIDALTAGDEQKLALLNETINQTRTVPGVARAVAGQQAKDVIVQDPGTLVSQHMPAGQAQRAGAMSPQTNLQKNAYTPYSTLREITRATSYMKQHLDALDQDATQIGLINQALLSSYTESPMAITQALQSVLNSEAFRKKMTTKSKNFVTAILSLREQMMGANRLITGAAGLSDSRVNAVWGTLPRGDEPSDLAKLKMAQVDGTIYNLSEAYPLIRQIPAMGNVPSGAEFMEQLRRSAEGRGAGAAGPTGSAPGVKKADAGQKREIYDWEGNPIK
jgi:hypothetical protein